MRAILTIDDPADDSEIQVPAEMFERLAQHTWMIHRTTAGNELFMFLPTGGTLALESAIVSLRHGGQLT